MTTDARLINWQSRSDADIRAWGGNFSQALTKCGLVRTADTGQIDWTTVVRPGAVYNGESYMGYEMYRFDDALQATRPVFLKIEWYMPWDHNNYYGWYMISMPSPIVSVGTVTNGAGALAGVVSTRQRLAYMAPYIHYTSTRADLYAGGLGAHNTSAPCNFFGDKSSIVMAIGATSDAQPLTNGPGGYRPVALPWMWTVERTRDPNGLPNGDGLAILTTKWTTAAGYAQPTGPTSTYQALSFTAQSASAVSGEWPVTWPGQAFGSGAAGSDLYVWPLSISSPKVGHMLGMLGIYKGDLGIGSEVVLPVLGANRRYKSLAGLSGGAPNDNTRSYTNARVPSGAFLMRWEET